MIKFPIGDGSNDIVDIFFFLKQQFFVFVKYVSKSAEIVHHLCEEIVTWLCSDIE